MLALVAAPSGPVERTTSPKAASTPSWEDLGLWAACPDVVREPPAHDLLARMSSRRAVQDGQSFPVEESTGLMLPSASPMTQPGAAQ
jgi:hypothetical protein